VEPERLEEFDRRYRAESLEALDFPGLRSVLLLHRHGRPTEAVGLSFWDGEEAAARYELSGRFEGLAARLDDTLVPLHRWRAGLAGASGGAGWVAPTLEVAGYRVLFSRTF
jgi:heme-degrading monooxygenase HmoA